ncbi:MAG: ferritin family protein [Planctomycetota bacterium]
MHKFTVEEALGIAVRIEKNAQEYYRRASEIVTDIRAKVILKDLALWEVRHETLFRKLEKEVIDSKINSSGVMSDVAGYLAAVADSSIFNISRFDSQLKDLPNDAHAILIEALNREKDSVVFYTLLKKAIPGDKRKEAVEEVISEEIIHIVEIMKKIDELLKK